MADASLSASATLATSVKVASRATVTAVASETNSRFIQTDVSLHSTASLLTPAYRAAALSASTTTSPTSSSVRISQSGVEIVLRTNSNARVTQSGIEIVLKGISNARITQSGIEVVAVPGGIRNLFVSASFSEILTRVIPVHAKFQETLSRTITTQASFASVTITRSVICHAIFAVTTTRTIPTEAVFGTSRQIPTRSVFGTSPFRGIFCNAELGLNRRIPTSAAFLGNPARGIPCVVYFRIAGHIPCFASFWKQEHTFNIYSSLETTKVMSLASHLVGGSLGSFAGFAVANSAPAPLGWQLPDYDDTFWPFGILAGGGLPIPYPIGDPNVDELDFNWAWPNETGDYSPTADPINDQVLLRQKFGMPADPSIARYTIGQLTVEAEGIFNTNISVVQINNFNLEFVTDVPHAGGGIERIFNVPAGIIQPGDNVIVMQYSTYIGGEVGSRNGGFRLVITYSPPNTGMSQVLG